MMLRCTVSTSLVPVDDQRPYIGSKDRVPVVLLVMCWCILDVTVSYTLLHKTRWYTVRHK